MNLASVRADPGYSALKNYVLKHTGLVYYGDKDEDFATRLFRRLQACEAPSCEAYLRLLTPAAGGDSEMDRLVGELTIGETYFFRQREHFDLLRQTILPDLIKRNADTRRLRIWSAGCATGPEPYSISLLLKLDFSRELKGWDVTILGTDINVEFLSRGGEAVFKDWALRAVPDEIKTRCFLQEGKLWRLRPELREGVVFQYDNLASSDHCPNDRPFDLILCRNVLIYFSKDQGGAVIARFHRCLAAGAWLLVGYAEPNMNLFREFETVSTPDATAYRKRGQEVRSRTPETIWEPFVWEGQPRGDNGGADKSGHGTSLVFKTTAAPEAPSGKPGELAATVEEVRTLADSGHWDAATALCDKLLKVDPLNPATHFVWALIQEHFGTHAGAQTAFQRAIYLDRKFALAYYHLGTSLERSGAQGAANRAFRNALDIATVLPSDEPLPFGDSITAGELRDLAMLRLEGVTQ